jgi:N-acetylmuramoyl-L-alanine amidase
MPPKIILFLLLLIFSFIGSVPSLFAQPDVQSTYNIKLASGSLRISGPRIVCPIPSATKVSCLNGAILIDPGHDDEEDSKRNKSKFFSEGRSNMAVALILRDLLVRCGGLSEEQVHLIRWPGEEVYGKFSSLTNQQNIHQPNTRLDGIASRVEAIREHQQNLTSPHIALSLHSNSSGNPNIKPDRVEVYFPEYSTENWKAKSAILLKAIVKETLPAYQASSQLKLTKIRSDVSKKSFTRPMDYAVLTDKSGPEELSKLVIEMFYMDSSQLTYLDGESNLDFPLNQRLTTKWVSSSGRMDFLETYALTKLQKASAIGIYNGLQEMQSCE